MGNKAYKDKHRELGLCVDCSEPAIDEHTRCEKHHIRLLQATAMHRAMRRAAEQGREFMPYSTMKILHLDIETAPNLAHVWGLWQQNVGLPQLLESTYMLCWSAKWDGQDDIFYSSIHTDGQDAMLLSLHSLLCETDVVVHYNGARFDIPVINREFLEAGISPPTPYKQVDLIQTVKRQFRFQSNKLEYVVKKLGIGEKLKHAGHEMWVDCCVHDKPEAWEKMLEYNKQDVVVTEALYRKILPWIQSHPNHNLFADGTVELCPQCGSVNLAERKAVPLNAGVYDGYRCVDCGKNIRGRYTKLGKEAKKNLRVPVHGA